MTKDEALKMALEALEVANSCIDGYYIPKGKTHLPEIEKAIIAIKEALAEPEHGWTSERIAGIARLKDAQDKRLAQPEQEPVTWRYKIVDVFGRPAWTLKTPKSDTRVLESQPLYTTPPQRKPLTDEEIILIVAECAASHQHTDIHFARSIERAHGIKELKEYKSD